MSYLRAPFLAVQPDPNRHERLFALCAQQARQSWLGANCPDDTLKPDDAQTFLRRAEVSLGFGTPDERLARQIRPQTSRRSSGIFG